MQMGMYSLWQFQMLKYYTWVVIRKSNGCMIKMSGWLN